MAHMKLWSKATGDWTQMTFRVSGFVNQKTFTSALGAGDLPWVKRSVLTPNTSGTNNLQKQSLRLRFSGAVRCSGFGGPSLAQGLSACSSSVSPSSKAGTLPTTRELAMNAAIDQG